MAKRGIFWGYFMASWLLPVLASALLLGVYEIFKKHALRDNSVMPILFWSSLCGALGYAAFLGATGKLAQSLDAPPELWGVLLFKPLLVGTSWFFGYYGLREVPITLASPLNATSLLWSFFGGLAVYGERLTWMQIAAAVVIFAGLYLFSGAGKLEGFTLRSRGIVLILLGTVVGAMCSLYDKYLLNIRQLPREQVQLFFSVGLVILFGISYLVRRFCFGNRHAFEWRWSIPFIGLFLIAADIFYFYAVSLPGTPISLVSLLRSTNCIVAFVFGAAVFHERNLKRKAVALVLFFLGIALLALSR